MIGRYAQDWVTELFSDRSKVQSWLWFEAAYMKQRYGDRLPADPYTVADDWHTGEILVRMPDHEKTTRHEFVAFLDAWKSLLNPAWHGFIHVGLTSSDIQDSTLASQLRDAANTLYNEARQLRRYLAKLALEHRGTYRLGRTHGQYAEPTGFGHQVAGWAFQLDRVMYQVAEAKRAVSVVKLSGPVGTYSQTAAWDERCIASDTNCILAYAATQVWARDALVCWAQAIRALVTACAQIGNGVWLGAQAGIDELQEAFAAGEQAGSSSMPHKRNPIISEQLLGLDRLAAGYVHMLEADVVLRGERDLSHSCVERVAVPDLCHVAGHALTRTVELVTGLQVNVEQMWRNLNDAGGAPYSSRRLAQGGDYMRLQADPGQGLHPSWMYHPDNAPDMWSAIGGWAVTER